MEAKATKHLTGQTGTSFNDDIETEPTEAELADSDLFDLTDDELEEAALYGGYFEQWETV